MIGLQVRAMILVGFAMLGAFFLSATLIDKLTEDKRFVQRRIDLVTDRKRKEEQRKAKKKDAKKSKKEAGFQVKQSFIQKVGEAIFEELLSANIMMKPEEFAFIWIVLAFIPALLSLPAADKNPFLPVILAIVGVIAPIIVVKKKQADRVKAFEAQLSDALLICCNCLRSGLTFAQAMENIAEEMEDPIGTEFKRAVNEMGFGSSLEEALNGLVERINSADLVLTVAAVNVQRQTGGNLSQILEVISNTIRDRLKIKSEIKALTSQGRMSGSVIGLLPVVIAMFLMLLNPEYILTFVETKIGNILLLACLALEAIGFIFINKIVDIKY